jgi:membrane protein DedA with SNARE-associated domain
MNVKKFCLFTGIGGGVWMATLTAVGYHIGGKEELVREYTPKVVMGGIALAVFAVVAYIIYIKKMSAGDNKNGQA